MAISYPINMPALPIAQPRKVTIRTISAVGVHVSPFTFQRQAVVRQGQLLELIVGLAPMKRDHAEEWISSLLKLNGSEGTFNFGDPANKTPRGLAQGTPKVNGASQTGNTLATDGWMPKKENILRAGDWFQVGTNIYKVINDAASDGSGQATLDIWPKLRSSPSDDATIVLNSPKGIFRLAGNQSSWDIDEAKFYGINFAAVEAI